MALLIKNAAFIATMDAEVRELRNQDILIEGPAIAAIGPNLTPPPAAEVLDASNDWVFPGLVNTHHHLFQTLTRCLPAIQEAELFPWLKYLYPVWAGLSADAVYVGALVGLGELLKSGCTTAVDHHYVFPRGESQLIDREIAAAKELGIRFHPCRGSMSLGEAEGGLPPDSVIQREEEILADSRRLIAKYHDGEPYAMCRIALAPCSPFSVTRSLLVQSVELAREYGVRCHTHLAETKDETRFCQEQAGMRPLEYMKDVGWLGSDIWFAHGIHFNEEELAELAATATGIAHCPASNQKLSSGTAAVPAMLQRGIPVGLAVDGSASNDGSNMLAELKAALLIAKLTWGIDSLSARDVLAMATLGGARLLGREDIGSLAPGKAADLFLVRADSIDYAGCRDPITALVTCGSSETVDTTIVNGRVVVEKGRLLTMEEEEIARLGNAAAGELRAKAGIA
ncbi:MAG: 8-oxoguanine deaminase [Eubacteriales bacterium]|nr:8-oxoguanine deaminase [Eubacteriales bacterium]